MDHECRHVRRASDAAGPLIVARLFILGLLVIGGLAPPQAKRAFTGTVTDGMCPLADHSRMRMGSTDAECAIACASSHGSAYVLYDGKDLYGLSDQQTPEKFAGKKVTVTGTLDAKTRMIHVDSIIEAK